MVCTDVPLQNLRRREGWILTGGASAAVLARVLDLMFVSEPCRIEANGRSGTRPNSTSISTADDLDLVQKVSMSFAETPGISGWPKM